LVNRSRTILCRPVSNPNATIRIFFIAVRCRPHVRFRFCRCRFPRYRFPFQKATWFGIKTGRNFTFYLLKKKKTLIIKINNKNRTTSYLGRAAGSAYTVTLYPNPTAPFVSQVTGRGTSTDKISPVAATGGEHAAHAPRQIVAALEEMRHEQQRRLWEPPASSDQRERREWRGELRCGSWWHPNASARPAARVSTSANASIPQRGRGRVRFCGGSCPSAFHLRAAVPLQRRWKQCASVRLGSGYGRN
jgi:hypothetical protein